MPRIRAMLALRLCWPRAPSAGVPGYPYRASRRCIGNMTCPPPGSCTPVWATATRAASRRAGPNRPPTASTCRGLAAESAEIAAGSARGS